MKESDRKSTPDRPNTHPADLPQNSVPSVPLADEDKRMARIGVGCFTTFIGAVSGSMIGVLVGVGATFATRCQPLEGLPACNWEYFWMVGGILGGITLPILVLTRLRRRDRAGT
jgi:glycerol uptake facilitator-like aquaporin